MNVEKIKTELLAQKESKFKGNIYHFLQTTFSYNSNKMEGSRLTEDQTEAIFETASFIPKENDAHLFDLYKKQNNLLTNSEIKKKLDKNII